jgi:hypothetical protein
MSSMMMEHGRDLGDLVCWQSTGSFPMIRFALERFEEAPMGRDHLESAGMMEAASSG